MKTLEKTLKTDGKEQAEILLEQLETVRGQYFAALKELQNTSYTSQWEQMPDIRKVSQLGLAVVELGKAYSAMNSVRCH